jgi:hypothetical protein
MAKKGSAAWKGEIKSTVYGLHRDTLDVVSVSLYRGGSMSAYINGNYRTVDNGTANRFEAALIFNLISTTEELAAGFDHPQIRADLEAEAAKIRQERAEAARKASEAPDPDTPPKE